MSVQLRSGALRDAHAPAVSSRRMPTRVGFLSFGSTIATLETWIGPSFSITPTCAFGRAGFGRWWRLTMFRPST